MATHHLFDSIKLPCSCQSWKSW